MAKKDQVYYENLLLYFCDTKEYPNTLYYVFDNDVIFCSMKGVELCDLKLLPIDQSVRDLNSIESTENLGIGQYEVRISEKVYREARAWVRQSNRIRSPQDETGGLLWGLWDDVVGVIWVFDASGPPPDSLHDPGHFVCGVEGTVEEHVHRVERSRGTCGFIGFWHTHPDMPSQQSSTDIVGMAKLVSRMGQNQQRALMLIFGRTKGRPSVGVYVYESESLLQATELVAVDIGQIELKTAVV